MPTPRQAARDLREELGGLQRISVQICGANQAAHFVERCACSAVFLDHPARWPPGVRPGDLVSEEEAIAIFALDVMRFRFWRQSPGASLEGEALVELEILFDRIRRGVRSLTWQQTVRVRAVAISRT